MHALAQEALPQHVGSGKEGGMAFLTSSPPGLPLPSFLSSHTLFSFSLLLVRLQTLHLQFLQAEAAMRALVREALPEHAVFGEEGGMTRGDGASPSEYLWIFDPIDGTKSFITGAHAIGTSFIISTGAQAQKA